VCAVAPRSSLCRRAPRPAIATAYARPPTCPPSLATARAATETSRLNYAAFALPAGRRPARPLARFAVLARNRPFTRAPTAHASASAQAPARQVRPGHAQPRGCRRARSRPRVRARLGRCRSASCPRGGTSCRRPRSRPANRRRWRASLAPDDGGAARAIRACALASPGLEELALARFAHAGTARRARAVGALGTNSRHLSRPRSSVARSPPVRSHSRPRSRTRAQPARRRFAQPRSSLPHAPPPPARALAAPRGRARSTRARWRNVRSPPNAIALVLAPASAPSCPAHTPPGRPAVRPAPARSTLA
jgi:hypothetical protein